MQFNRRDILSTLGAMGATALLPTRLTAGPATIHPARAVRADLDLLLRAYTAVHPGLGRYLPPGGFAARVEAMKAAASAGLSQAEMFIGLSRLTAAVRCGHSHVNPHNQTRAVEESLLGGQDRIPFAFRWIDGRMIVTGKRGPSELIEPGAEVLEVDGVAARQLLRAMLPLTRADGSSDGKRVAQLGVSALDQYAAFDVFRPMLFRAAGGGVVRIRSVSVDGAETTRDLPALSETQLRKAGGGLTDARSWTFELDGAGIGLLRMPNWVTYRSKWDWQGYLDGVIDRLIDERARGLIIDLRGNEGGTECGWRIIERLIVRDIQPPRFIYRTRYRTLPTELHAPLDTWDPAFRDWGAAASGPDERGFYRLQREGDDAGPLRPRGRRFTGRVAVLIDSSCSSATFQFAQAVKESGVATLIGQTTGGNRRGINGGAYFFVRLPETGLEVDLPIIGSFPPTAQPDAGIEPDIPAPVSVRDLRAGRDRALAVARRVVGAPS